MPAENRNPFSSRMEKFVSLLARRRLDAAAVCTEAGQKGLAGFGCDNGILLVERSGRAVFFTDFRYVPAAKREAPWLSVKDIGRFAAAAAAIPGGRRRRIGYEGAISAERYHAFAKKFKGATLVDVWKDILLLRAVKTPEEIAKISAAAALNDEIWRLSRKEIRPGMTEKEIQRTIRAWMNALGDGESFETIVCAGANAAECHHVPDGTVWRRGEPLLVDMGVKLDGYCSDMTRCIKGRGKPQARYGEIYSLVLMANRAAVAAVKPGITGKRLDRVARSMISKAGYGKLFGHSLGHGVGLEIHEQPVASKKSDVVLEPGMIVTIEPGVYIEGDLGVRIEDLVLVTEYGCEVLSKSPR